MAVTEEQLNALVQFYKKGKAKYGIGLAGPDEEFVPESDLVSATPTGLLTPIEEIDHRPTTTHDRLSSQQAIRLPASPAPEPVPWRPEMEDPEFTDFVLGLRTRPFDYISSMASAKKTLPITRGMEFDMELLTLRSYPRKHDTPHFFALNREGKMAVESLGQDFPPALSDNHSPNMTMYSSVMAARPPPSKQRPSRVTKPKSGTRGRRNKLRRRRA